MFRNSSGFNVGVGGIASFYRSGNLVRNIAVMSLAACMNMTIVGAASAARLSAGGDHTLAIKADGTVWAWGYNIDGQLGNGSITQTPSPLQVSGLTRIVSVSAHSNTSAAVQSNGTVWAWGKSIGLVPVQVSGLINVTAVAAADPTLGDKLVALKSDGTVWTWSYNAGVNTTPVQVTGLTNVRAVDKRYSALRADGTVWNWGYNGATQTAPIRVPGLTNVRAIAVGAAHTLALKIDGSVWGWGSNNFGQLGDGTQINRVTPVRTLDLTNVISIAASESRGVSQAVKSDGTVWMWGYNTDGQIVYTGNGSGGIGEVFTRPRAIGSWGTYPIVANIEASVGRAHGVALQSDGLGLSWGQNGAGQGGTGNYNAWYAPANPTQIATTF